MLRSEITFHIGLPKTATTFLQKEVFPRWPGISFSQNYGAEEERRLREGEAVLVSDEAYSGRPWGRRNGHGETWRDDRRRELRTLAERVPQAKIMLCLRKHESLILSLYRQYLHEGGTQPLSGFWGGERRKGVLCAEDLRFSDYVDEVNDAFAGRVFVFTFGEIVGNLNSLLGEMALFLGNEAPNTNMIRISRRNEGVRAIQASILRRLNALTKSTLNPKGPLRLNNRITEKLGLKPRQFCQRRLRFLPSKPIRFEPFQQKEIERLFSGDWGEIQERVAQRAAKLRRSFWKPAPRSHP